MEQVIHALNWFELPVTDFGRAKAFYSAIFDYEMPEMTIGEALMGMLPFADEKSVGGAIVQMEGYKPSAQGTLVYLNGGNDLSVVLGRIEAAGGTVLVEKTQITEEIGYCAFFLDTEGNKVGLHSPH